MKTLLMAISLFFTACGAQEATIHARPTPSQADLAEQVDFSAYTTHFKTAFKASKAVDVVMVESMAWLPEGSSSTMGVCTYDSTGAYARKIYINKAYWSIMSEGSRQILIDHEQLHCVKNAQHDSSVLMNEYASDLELTMEAAYQIEADYKGE
jgi:hypothetical protein